MSQKQPWFQRVFLTSTHDQSPADRAAAHVFYMLLGFFAVIAGGLAIMWFSLSTFPDTAPLWPAQALARVSIGKLPGGMLGYALAYVTSVIGYRVWIRSREGKTQGLWKNKVHDPSGGWHWPEEVALRAVMLENQGRNCAAWVLGSLIFWGLVLGGK